MISKGSIAKNMAVLDGLYLSANDPIQTLFYAKLTTIELCGWIEEAMDSIITQCANRCIKTKCNLHSMKKVVKKTYGFDYDKHFRKMLITMIGLVITEKIEKKLDSQRHDIMKASLSSLKRVRDNIAHTHTRGTTLRLDSPSVLQTRFEEVYDGLVDIETQLKLAV